MKLRQRLQQRLQRRDDSGAALVIALLFVTVVAVAIAGVLSYADANVRATRALRQQAATVAAAETAADVAINMLRKSTYTGSGDCFPSGPLQLTSFNPPMTVTCEDDDASSQSGATGTPSGYALLALQNNSTLEDAIYVKANGPATGINVAGDVGSASNVFMDHGDMHITGSLDAKICTGTINVTGTRNCGPSAPSLTDPNYPAPPTPTVAGTISPCAAKRTFTPGVYSDRNALNDAWSGCAAATVFDFRPGIYYFAFNGVWRIDKGTTIGGSSSPLGNTPPAIPGACPNPMINTGSTDGVTFVFGDEAQLLITDNAKLEICGRRPPSGSSDPSIAFYGLKNTLGSGPLRVQAQSGCITRVGSGSRCAVITTDNHSDGVRFYFQGHVYMPRAKVDLDLRKSSDQYLNGGVTVRSFSLFSPASSVIPTPLSSGPIVIPRPGRTVVLLTVYVSGDAKLKVKVGFNDVDGSATAGERGVTVYNWSVLR